MANQATQIPRMKQIYHGAIKTIADELKISNSMRLPKLEKIVVSCGIGNAAEDKKVVEVAINTLRKITGQQPVKTIARKSIAAFKLREGSVVGLKVTLRGRQMYEFYDRLVTVVLPRTRDFHGINPKSLDGSGNLNIGLADQSIFPELTFEETSNLHGLQITISTTAKSQFEGYVLLKHLGLPFQKDKEIENG